MSPIHTTDTTLPNIDPDLFDQPTGARLAGAGLSVHAPRFLMLYGSLRERSYSKLLTLEAARLLQAMGGEVRIFDPGPCAREILRVYVARLPGQVGQLLSKIGGMLT